jgi:hypothetical protein
MALILTNPFLFRAITHSYRIEERICLRWSKERDFPGMPELEA